MEKNNKNMGTIKALMVLVGVLAVVASYFLVFTEYKTKNEELSTEIEELQARYDDLEYKNRNKAEVVKNTEENNKKTDEVLAKFDGGLSYQAEIIDLQNFIDDKKIKAPALTLSQISDVFTFADGNVGKSMTYNYASTGTYEQMKDALKYFDEYEGKRKVPTSIGFVYNYATQEVTLSFNVTEYAVEGEGREIKPYNIPEYSKGNLNIFYDEVIRLG
ncbi:MAG: hypothetical protein IJA34_08670 [Lachnospiraceae bacterium]|nr:hypothetical protein [Lachnospiraceae bacterium]